VKWFRHMAATWEDEKIARLVSAGGKDGLALYGAYWRVLEIVASQMRPGTSQCSVRYGVTRWSVLLSVRGSHLSHYLGHLSKSGLVTTEWIGTDIRVTVPNLLKYRDEYSSKSRHPQEIVPPTSHQQSEEQTDVQIQTQKTTSLPTDNDAESAYLGRIRQKFLARGIVAGKFSKADEKLARELYSRGTPIETVEHAILLGSARKCKSVLDHESKGSITSLRYFVNLFEDEELEQTSAGYWQHIESRLTGMEKQLANGTERPQA
jgi:hypothetical protein